MLVDQSLLLEISYVQDNVFLIQKAKPKLKIVILKSPKTIKSMFE